MGVLAKIEVLVGWLVSLFSGFRSLPWLTLTCLDDSTINHLCLSAGVRYTLLDLDKPFCDLGVAAVLHRLFPPLGRNYLV